jgi:hypothetical protein
VKSDLTAADGLLAYLALFAVSLGVASVGERLGMDENSMLVFAHVAPLTLVTLGSLLLSKGSAREVLGLVRVKISSLLGVVSLSIALWIVLIGASGFLEETFRRGGFDFTEPIRELGWRAVAGWCAVCRRANPGEWLQCCGRRVDL